MRTRCLMCALTLSVLLAVAILSTPRPSIAARHSPAQPTPVVESPCSGTLTTTLSDDTIAICESLSLASRVESSCPRRLVHIVFVQPRTAPESEWMNNTSLRALTELVSRSSELDIRAGVVQYPGAEGDPTGRVVELTSDLAKVRAWLDVAKPYPGVLLAQWSEDAARSTTEMLRDGRAALGQDSAAPIEIVIFFVAVKPPATAVSRQVLRAASIFRSTGATLVVGCPSQMPGQCNTARDIATPGLYTEPTALDKLRLILRDELNSVDDAPLVAEAALIQVLPPVLEYVTGTASEPPTFVQQTITGTRLVWTWNPPMSSQPYAVTFDARPIAPGTGDIEGELALIDTYGVSSQKSEVG